MMYLIFAVLTIVCLFFLTWGLIVVIRLWVMAAILAGKNKTDRSAAGSDGGRS